MVTMVSIFTITMVAMVSNPILAFITDYFYILLILAPLLYYILRPMADAVLKFLAIVCGILGGIGFVLYLIHLI